MLPEHDSTFSFRESASKVLYEPVKLGHRCLAYSLFATNSGA
jgi:hypothetical protein